MQKVGNQFRMTSMASAKNIELETDSSCDSIDTHCNATEIEAEFHNSSCDSIYTWFTAVGSHTDFNNSSCDSSDVHCNAAEIEAEFQL